MGRFDDLPRKMFHPDLLPLKRRIIGFIIGIPLAYMIGKFYYRMPDWSCILMTVTIAVFAAVALFMELRSNRKDKEFKNAIANGEYHQDEKWRQKYARYVDKHDFKQVKGDSMRSDLSLRYLSVSGIVMLCDLGFVFRCSYILENRICGYKRDSCCLWNFVRDLGRI